MESPSPAATSGVRRSVFGPNAGIRSIVIEDFGGPGVHNLSFAAPDVATAEDLQQDVLCASLQMPLNHLTHIADAPRGLQIGCVPEECESQVQSTIEEHMPCMRFVAKAARARCYIAPALVPQQADLPAAITSVETLRDAEVHMSWLVEALRPRGYPEEYVRYLATSEITPPRVAMDSHGKPVAQILQEATDLSIGALEVDEQIRGQGIGQYLLTAMGHAVVAGGDRAVSLVEDSNQASQRLHAKAGWEVAGSPVVWLIFAPASSA